ncbi:MAG: AraC family transcriptional regulator [Bacillota bacterium]
MNYYDKIQKSIDYIEQHLKDNLSTCSIAEQAFFSVTHFYRIFQAMVGDPVKEYIRKRRLSQTAIELLTSDIRIIELAIDYGFESQEVFTRAFSKQFGITPGRYRRQKEKIVLYEKVNVEKKAQMKLNSVSFFVPRIILNKTFHVVGLKQIVNPGSDSIGTLWAAFHVRRSEIECPSSTDAWLGLCEYMPDITDESDFTYTACIEVYDFNNIPNGMTIKTVQCSKYAVFTHRGSLNDLKKTYNYIYGVWLPESGHELAELDTMEYYDYRASGSDSEFDIYIPVK